MSLKHKIIFDTINYLGIDPDIFFETGTGEAETLRAMQASEYFEWHFSCEVDLHQYLKSLEVMMYCPNATVVYGPSKEVMPRLLPHLQNRKIVFWLDAHFNEGHELFESGCPTMDELGNIAAHHPEGNLIFIDDAHLFGVDPAYPTPEDIGRWVRYHGYGIERVEDIYCIAKD